MKYLLSFAGTGLACPQGLYSAAALAAARVGLARFTRLEAPAVTISRLSLLDTELSRGDRMRALMSYALTELAKQPWNTMPVALPIFLALPAPDSGAPYDELGLLDALHDEAHTRLGRKLVLAETAIIRTGRAGLFTAIERAAAFLATSTCNWGLVGAVDSLVDGETVRRLADQNLLLGDSNMDGRIVSEAASFFLIGKPSASSSRTFTLGFAEEKDRSHTFAAVQAGAKSPAAHALTRLFRRLGATCSSRVDAVFSAQPGDGYWGREFSYAYLRNVNWMPEPLRMQAIGTAHGDAGAASGALALLHALASMSPGRGSSRPATHSALLYGVSDCGMLSGCTVVAMASQGLLAQGRHHVLPPSE